MFAGLLTLIEIGGLMAIIFGAGFGEENLYPRLDEIELPKNLSGWSGVAGAALLAFFAFIGFEDINSLAEETKDPQRTLAWGIFITLMVSMLLYGMVSTVAVLAIPPSELAGMEAPLATVFAPTTEIFAVDHYADRHRCNARMAWSCNSL